VVFRLLEDGRGRLIGFWYSGTSFIPTFQSSSEHCKEGTLRGEISGWDRHIEAWMVIQTVSVWHMSLA
jgi:hypothetical protein